VTRHAASGPTSGLSGYLSSKYAFDISFATLLLRIKSLECCVDRLRSHLKAVVRVIKSQAIKSPPKWA
jgi:hypothetical protein